MEFSKNYFIFILLIICTINTHAFQNVNIPDVNFKTALLEHGKTITGSTIGIIDTNNDGEIQVTEALAYNQAIYVYNSGINNLTGIEAFENINYLTFSQNNVSNVNLSKNTKLQLLQCNTNNLTSLDLSNNIELLAVYCENNSITSLNISNNLKIHTLNCSSNDLTTIDVSLNTLLQSFLISNNNLSTINISNNSELTTFYINSNNNLTTLNVTNNNKLTALFCENNNALSSLNLASGNNTRLNIMYARNNPNLTCVQIDTGFTPPTNGNWKYDNTVSFNTSCATASVDELTLDNYSFYPNPTTEVIHVQTTHTIKQLSVYNILGKKIREAKNNQIVVKDLAKGIYLLKVLTENGKLGVKRFIKK